MRLFQLLQSVDPAVLPEHCKIHLAVWNGTEDPLDVYLAGDFDEWQRGQRRKNFERPLVVSLIGLSRPGHWLFAGVHDSLSSEVGGCGYVYELKRRPATDEFDGRLIVAFARPGRQSYLRAERWVEELEVAEIRPERMRVSDFRGYSWAMLDKRQLDIVVSQRVDSWKAALSAVSGVYVISDIATGKLYVGSATAGEGIWSRWGSYSSSGHGGNKELRILLEREGNQYANNFRFGVLEIADTHASNDDVLKRESYWKDLLLSRAPHGYNAN